MQFTPISRERHGDKTWARPAGYRAFAAETFVPLVAPELTKAGADLPICFVRTGETFVVAALLSTMERKNLYIGPNGRWLGAYVPSWIRAYPFRLLRKEGTTEMVLCVDEAGAKLGEGEETFFDESGKPSKSVAEILHFLRTIEGARLPTDLAVASLAEAGLIVPWEIRVQDGETERKVAGAYKVDGKALEEIDDELHLKLRKAGALPIAYAQLLSEGRLEVLERLVRFHARAAADEKRAAPAAENRFSLTDNDELIF